MGATALRLRPKVQFTRLLCPSLEEPLQRVQHVRFVRNCTIPVTSLYAARSSLSLIVKHCKAIAPRGVSVMSRRDSPLRRSRYVQFMGRLVRSASAPESAASEIHCRFEQMTTFPMNSASRIRDRRPAMLSMGCRYDSPGQVYDMVAIHGKLQQRACTLAAIC